MNSEELEQSLRAEFESYLKDHVAKMRDEVDEFQKQIEAEFEKHRSHVNEAFLSFSNRFDTVPELDGGFRETVVEHLRLAKDEGAQITATAMAEAEDLERASAPAAIDLSEIKDALDDISAKDTQSAILKSLITHAAKYTPRGAFFIIKNDNFAGWKVFGKEAGDSETAIRDIHFPLSSDSILSSSVRALKTVEGSFGAHADDGNFLEPLHFGQPDRMYAVPLIARGRGVAVLYCDYGHEGVTVNTDAIEMLVKVAGLTVELLASTRAVHPGVQQETAASAPPVHDQSVQHAQEEPQYGDVGTISPEPSLTSSPADEVAESYSTPDPFSHDDHAQTAPDSGWDAHAVPTAETFEHSDQSDHAVHAQDAEHTAAHDLADTAAFDFRSQFDMATEYVPESSNEVEAPSAADTDEAFIAEPVSEKIAELEHFDTQPVEEIKPEAADTWSSSPASSFEPSASEFSPAEDVSTSSPAMVFDDSAAAFEPADEAELHTAGSPFESQPAIDETPASFDTAFTEPGGTGAETFDIGAADHHDTAPHLNGGAVADAPAVAEQTTARPVGSRLSDRNVDLPIEVADDERRLHNDARRFARLLVSEIKLYNEKKVQEGRESNDLYERLREAIDRSREMYDKRVQPPVASKFDYFHYELVNSLAGGAVEKLGQSYKGASV